MTNPLQGKRVVLGVTGSIACYKAVDLASKMTQLGAKIDVVMTDSAAKFVSPLTFRSITHRPVLTDLFDPVSDSGIYHISLAERADVVVIAPATANFIAKAAAGLADDALGAVALAANAPMLIAPAMDGHMYENPATQENLQKLRERNVYIAGPAFGRLASGISGSGRLIETPQLLGHVALVLGREGDLAGWKIVVSAGGTREAIDPVRFITNRSSGKMGYAVAEAARDRGAAVSLVAAPTGLLDPVGVAVTRVSSAHDMRRALMTECHDADVLVMAAAVSDWRPRTTALQKLKKAPSEHWSIDLIRTPDIIAEIDSAHLVKIGFAAETECILSNARAKIQSKGLDLIAANDVTAESSGFEADTNQVTLIDRDGCVEELPILDKYEVGHRILDRALQLMKRS